MMQVSLASGRFGDRGMVSDEYVIEAWPRSMTLWTIYTCVQYEPSR